MLEGSSTKVSVKIGVVVIDIDQQSLLAAGTTRKQKNVAADPWQSKATSKKKVNKDQKPIKTIACKRRNLQQPGPSKVPRLRLSTKSTVCLVTVLMQLVLIDGSASHAEGKAEVDS